MPALPDLPVPSGASFRFLPTPTRAFGVTDFRIKLAGMPAKAVRLHVDGAPIGDAMLPLAGGIYHQEIDTSLYVDGVHEVAAAALDGNGRPRVTSAVSVEFHNIERVELQNIVVDDAKSSFTIPLIVHAARVQLPQQLVAASDATAEEGQQPLATELTYSGEMAPGGLPIGILRASRPSGKGRFAVGEHKIVVVVSDLQGRYRARGNIYTLIDK